MNNSQVNDKIWWVCRYIKTHPRFRIYSQSMWVDIAHYFITCNMRECAIREWCMSDCDLRGVCAMPLIFSLQLLAYVFVTESDSIVHFLKTRFYSPYRLDEGTARLGQIPLLRVCVSSRWLLGSIDRLVTTYLVRWSALVAPQRTEFASPLFLRLNWDSSRYSFQARDFVWPHMSGVYRCILLFSCEERVMRAPYILQSI